jgi:hypothetical protein
MTKRSGLKVSSSSLKRSPLKSSNSSDEMFGQLTSKLPELTAQYMDNFGLEVTARGSDVLELMVYIAMADHLEMRAYKEDVGPNDIPRLVFYWHYEPSTDKDVVPFPYPHKLPQVLSFLSGWLQQVEYGDQPDLDGSCSKGWRVTNQGFGGWSYATFAVEPIWAEHHK